MEPNSDIKSKSCIKVEHGSPVSNRSVSFAAAPDDSSGQRKSKKHMKLRDAKVRDSERLDRLSQKSCDSSISNTSNDNIPCTRKSVRLSGVDDSLHCVNMNPSDNHDRDGTNVERITISTSHAPAAVSLNSDTPTSLNYIKEN